MVQERTGRPTPFERGSEASANSRWRTKWIIPLGVSACYLAFALAVQMGILDSLDMAVRRATQTGVFWGPEQIRAARVVYWLQPAHLGLPLLLLVAALSLVRRSLRPFVVAAVVSVPVIVVTLATKWVMARTETNATPIPHGSFPSGHTVTAIVVVGVAVLLLSPGTRWRWILPTFMGCVIGSALVFAWVHPATDVIGAGLLALAALTGAQAAGMGEWARFRQTRSVR
jgi:membrane-associated phospholipid phosphatase